jgi:hypothetical protein
VPLPSRSAVVPAMSGGEKEFAPLDRKREILGYYCLAGRKRERERSMSSRVLLFGGDLVKFFTE